MLIDDDDVDDTVNFMSSSNIINLREIKQEVCMCWWPLAASYIDRLIVLVISSRFILFIGIVEKTKQNNTRVWKRYDEVHCGNGRRD